MGRTSELHAPATGSGGGVVSESWRARRRQERASSSGWVQARSNQTSGLTSQVRNSQARHTMISFSRHLRATHCYIYSIMCGYCFSQIFCLIIFRRFFTISHATCAQHTWPYSMRVYFQNPSRDRGNHWNKNAANVAPQRTKKWERLDIWTLEFNEGRKEALF